MTITSFRPQNLKRYREVVQLLLKYGWYDVVKASGLDWVTGATPGSISSTESTPSPEQLARDLEALGPTFVKLGQLLSTRPDLLSPPYLEALSRLQDDVAPFPFEKVADIIEAELGLPIDEAFSVIEPLAIAAASLGQVHRARLPGGRQVAVKVQRPDIQQEIMQDINAFKGVAAAIDQHTDIGRRYAFQDILEEFRRTLLRELDYRREAHNLEQIGQRLARYRHLFAPRPIETHTTARVLTMEYVDGDKISQLKPAVRQQVPGRKLATELTRAYLDQILVDGFFHADPHPGNVFVTPDHRLALIDMGMVSRVAPHLQVKLLKLVLAVNDERSTEAAAICMDIGTPLADHNETRFTRQVAGLVARYHDATVQPLQLGRIVLDLARVSATNSIRPAPELTVVGKMLLHLDEIGRRLDPDFNPNAVVRHHSQSILMRYLLRSLSPGKIFPSLLELNEFVQALPRRANALLNALARREFEIKVNAVDETRLISSLQKIANRITMGLVLAALIVGAALVMRVDTPFTIFGYPALALVLFLLAAGFGVGLVVSIFVQDVWRRK